MEQDIETIIRKSRPNLRDITIRTYVSKIDKFLNKNDINNPQESIKYLHLNYSKKTVKSFLIALKVYLNALGEKELEEQYGKEMKRLNDIIQNEDLQHIPTKKERENMVTKKEITDLIESLKEKFQKLALKRDAFTYFEIYKRYLVLNLYHLIPPLRNDFIGCEVYEDTLSLQDMEKNYIFLKDKKLVLNRYKTRNTYGTGNTVELPQELVDIIRRWIEIRNIIRPEIKNVKELLLTQDFAPMKQVNLTQFLNRIFGKNVSTTMLRKSYLSEKYPVTTTGEEMKKDAKSMTHSVSTQQTTYRKK